MRRERDSLGEWLLSEDDYFGIGTARIVSAIDITGPCVPREIGANVIRIRQAQAIAFGKLGQWSALVAESIQATTAKMLSEQLDWSPNIRINTLHGGGARSYVSNVDEVIINLALVEGGRIKGDYHQLSVLGQLNTEADSLNTFMIAVHVALIERLNTAIAMIRKTIEVLKNQSVERNCQETVERIHYQEIKLTDMGCAFQICAESLARILEQMEYYRKQLRTVWRGPEEVLCVLREVLGVELEQAGGAYGFPVCADLYIGLSSIAKMLATTLLSFCNKMRFYVGVSKELESPRYRVGPAFNPTVSEMIVLDSVCQSAFHVIGCDAVIGQAVTSGSDGIAAYFPQIASNLMCALKGNTDATHLLVDKFLLELKGTSAIGAQAVAASCLQAEKLVPILGYERAVQVARIAALTEKPIKIVVVKMKMMTEQQADECFSATNKYDVMER